MADTFNLQNKKISASSLFGGDKVEKYRQELIAEGKIPGTKLNATSEERVQAFKLYRKNKIDFKNFVEKVLQKKNSVAYSGISKKSINTKRLTSTGALIKAPKNNLGIILKKSKETSTEETQTNSSSILKILESILNTLRNQFKFDKKKSEEDRKEEESGRRKKREDALEGVKKIGSKIVDKLVAPFKSILDKIFNFIFFTLLGRAFTKLMDWLGDPKNSQKVAVLGRFLKDWWPALLGLYFMPFKGFMLRTLGRIAWFTAKWAAQKTLLTPAGAAAAAVAGLALAANKVTGQKEGASIQAKQKARAQTGKALTVQGTDIESDKIKTTGDLGPVTPYGLLQKVSSGGLINSNTGTRITGAGRDTQLTALQPGEIVMNRAAVRGVGADKLLGLNAMYGDSNANKPKYTGNIQTAADGGMVGSNSKPSLSGTSAFGDLPLIKAANSAGIKGLELASFLSQMSHETGGYKWDTELGGGSNDYSGGKKYKGRGYIQLTHDYNYKKYGDKLGIDLVRNPDLATNKDIAAKIAVMYWKENVRPAVGNNWNDVFSVSRAINNPSASSPKKIRGYKDRISRFEEYKNKLNSGALSIEAPAKPKPKSKPNSNIFSKFASFMPTSLPFAGGGLIGENTGMNISGATADRQLTSLQPGEYVLPKDTVDRLGVSLIDRLVAMTDNNSTAAKLGARSNKRYTPGPLSRAGRGGMMMLPPITQSGGGGGVGAPAAGTQVPSFSAVSPSGGTERAMNASIYGIVG